MRLLARDIDRWAGLVDEEVVEVQTGCGKQAVCHVRVELALADEDIAQAALRQACGGGELRDSGAPFVHAEEEDAPREFKKPRERHLRRFCLIFQIKSREEGGITH